MIRKHDMKLLNSFQLDCEFNNISSILFSIEPQIIKEIRENCYGYHVEKREAASGITFNRIILDLRYGNLLKNRLKKFNSIFYVGKEDLVAKLRKVIDCSMYAFVMVDLYDYIPRSICYHKYHWYHYTLVVGYDDAKETFFVLDDDYYGYREFEISADKLFRSIKKDDKEENVLYIDFYERISVKDVTIFQLKKNARKIVRDIKKIIKEKYYLMDDSDYEIEFDRNLTVIMFNKIRNRHIINVQLFIYLSENKMIHETAGKVLVFYAKELQNEWQTLIEMYYRAYERECLNCISKVNQKLKEVFEKERKMWNLFLKT